MNIFPIKKLSYLTKDVSDYEYVHELEANQK